MLACFVLEPEPYTRWSVGRAASSPERGFRNCEITDGVVDHDGSGAELCGDRFSSRRVSGPDASGKREGRIIRARDCFVGVSDGLDGEDRTERFFLEEA